MALTKRKAKYITVGVLAAAVLTLVIQNSGNTRIQFLFWERPLPTLVVILGVFLVGLFVGRVLFRRR